MPDITMCLGKDETRACPHAHECYRATATPTPRRQSYFMVLPLSVDNLTCDHYWPPGKEPQ